MARKNLAPVVLFAFNRPDHTQKTLDAITGNHLAPETDLFVFVDGPRNEADLGPVQNVCEIVASTNGTRSLTLVRQNENVGLARNIVSGINEVLEKHDRIIVLEDDIVTSPAFLNYMNEGLSHFEAEGRVWHICGYNEPTGGHNTRKTHFSRLMNCWGWGTWRDRWRHFEKDPAKLRAEFTPEMIDRFNLDIGEKFWFQVEANADGRMNTWAIFWYATIFRQGGLCLNPDVSYVRNIGFDGSGVHCDVDDIRNRARKLNQELQFEFPETLVEDSAAFDTLKKFYLQKKTKPGKLQKLNRKIFGRLRVS